MSTTIVASDLDGTLTTAEFWQGILDWLAENRPSSNARNFVRNRLRFLLFARLGLIEKETLREMWLRDIAMLLKGLPVDRLGPLSDTVVEQCLWPGRRSDVMDRVLRVHEEESGRAAGAKLVIATSAFQPVADAFARRIGADLALGTPLEVANGLLTGKLAAPVGRGEQKAAAVRSLADDVEVAAAFGDRASDAPLLRMARRPFAVAPDKELRAEALRAGWEIIEGA